MATTHRIRFAPELEALGEAPALEALGISSVADLFQPHTLATWSRAEVLPGSEGEEVRFPLPGTPDADGRVHERPRGAGTGWLRLALYETSLSEGLTLRFTNPRSASMAERLWNLACKLRAAGVSTPEPLAVAGLGSGLFSARSALVVRELTRSVTLGCFLHTPMSEGERRLGIEAVGRALARLPRSGVLLPGLSPEGIIVELRGEGTCGASTPGAVGEAGSLRRLPGVSVTELGGGSLLSPGHARLAEAYDYLASEVQGLLMEGEWSLLAETPEREVAAHA